MARQAQIVSFKDAKTRSRGGSRLFSSDESERSNEGAVKVKEQRSRASQEGDWRRKRTKTRADKMFDKQFASAAPSSSLEEGAPRPAVYEGKMGSSHRKSARMQRSSAASPTTSKINPAGWLATTTITARSLRIATGVLCLILVCAFLYVPAQQYYQAQREHDRLVAEYGVIEQRNEVLDVQNDILASDAGMEDAVRQKYGYVKSGEQTAVVTGLSENATDTARDSENIEANILSSSVRSPEEWYTPFLDAFFGVE